MENYPLVTVICLCYNHSKYVKESIDSVFYQSYPFIELIIVDDCSIDNSVEIIREVLSTTKDVVFLENNINIGNCRSFNQALKIAKGKYVVDLAADDVLVADKIETQVRAFEQLDNSYGLVFTNGTYINEKGDQLYNHYTINENGQALENVAQGDVFKRLFLGHFICSPTVMFKTEILNELGGYDETLSYEDFDIWMRIARNYYFYYFDKITVSKRVVSGSLSSKFYDLRQNRLLHSTLKICIKGQSLCRKQEELNALAQFIKYHLKLAFFTNNFELCHSFYSLLKEIKAPEYFIKIIHFLSAIGLKLGFLYRIYLRLRLKDTKL